MNIINVRARNNSAFILARRVPAWAAIYPLATCEIVAQMRATPDSPTVAFEWSRLNGKLEFDEPSRLLILRSEASEMSGFSGSYSYDVRVNYLDVQSVMFGGTIEFEQGVTRSGAYQ